MVESFKFFITPIFCRFEIQRIKIHPQINVNIHSYYLNANVIYICVLVVDAGNALSIQPRKSSLNLIKLVAHKHFESNDRQLAQSTALYVRVRLFQSTTHL